MMSDAALVLRARGGDERAFGELRNRFVGFTRFVADKYFLPGGDQDDLVQEGLFGLFKAVRDYRADRGATFQTFAEGCIRRQIITAVKTGTRGKHGPLNWAVSLNQPPIANRDDADVTLGEVLPSDEADDPLEVLCAQEDFREFLDAFDGLSELERTVATRLVGGDSYAEVVALVGAPHKTVDNAMQRARRKIAAALASNGGGTMIGGDRGASPLVCAYIENHLRDHPGSTAQEIADAIGWSKASVFVELKRWGPELSKARAREGKSHCWYLLTQPLRAAA